MEQASDATSTGGTAYVADVRRATLRLLPLYWGVEFIVASLLWGVQGVDPIESALGKLMLLVANLAMAVVISLILLRIRGVHIAVKAAACFGLSVLAAFAYAGVDFALYLFWVRPPVVAVDWTNFGYTAVYGMSLFFGWSCMFVALLFSFEVRDRERRLAASREEALSAQMRALRYQVNPHFLFNTLNAVAGLIEEGSADAARRMVLSLSSFLRTTLTLDPLHDVRLADELALQTGYLDIEAERFSDRMRVRIDVAPELEDALVPSLILQPLVENAVKHGVGVARGQVEILIRAGANGRSLNLSVENDIAPADAAGPPRLPGAGIGLRNVAERIAARFPGVGSLVAGRVGGDRFRAALTLPLRLA